MSFLLLFTMFFISLKPKVSLIYVSAWHFELYITYFLKYFQTKVFSSMIARIFLVMKYIHCGALYSVSNMIRLDICVSVPSKGHSLCQTALPSTARGAEIQLLN